MKKHSSLGSPVCTLYVLLLASLLGCEGLGRPLVDAIEPEPPAAPALCGSDLACDSIYDARAIDVLALQKGSLDLAACGGAEPTCAKDPATSAPDGPLPNCLRLWKADESLGKRLERQAFSCSALNVFADVPETVRIERFRIYSSNLSFKASVPVTIELNDAVLAGSWISLAGPVTLKLAEGWVENTRFELAPEAKLELERTSGERMTVYGTQQASHGSLVMRRGSITEAYLEADDVRLESVRLQQTQIDARVLSAVDMGWDNGKLRVEEGTLAGVALSAVDIEECGALNILQSVMTSVGSAACSEVLRVYTSSVSESSLEGPIQSDLSSYEKVRFGATEPTRVSAWDSKFNEVVFCDRQQELWIGGTSDLECIACAEATDEFEPCTLPEGMTTGDIGACELLGKLAVCPEPYPERERP